MSIFKKIFSPYADGKNENSDKAAPEENGKSEMQKKSSAHILILVLAKYLFAP